MLVLNVRISLLSSIVLLSIFAFPAVAEIGNFAGMTLALGFNKQTATVTGHTGGSYSLSSIANIDRQGNPCIGYGDPEPDHTMVLENDFPRLSLQVNSSSDSTTLVVKGPDAKTIRCSYGNNNEQDALIRDTQWKAGRYEIWVGSLDMNQRLNYRLSAQQY